MEPSEYDDILLCKILCQRYGTGGRWEGTIDQEMVAMHRTPCASTPLILILMLISRINCKLFLYNFITRVVRFSLLGSP
jgi:hypothetical protein